MNTPILPPSGDGIEHPERLPLGPERPAVLTRLQAVRRAFHLSNRRLLVLFCFLVLSFFVLAFRIEINGHDIAQSQATITDTQRRLVQTQDELNRLVYRQCLERNAGAARSNAVIQAAIDAEKRKPAPDAIRMRALENFKQAIPSCGVAPSPRPLPTGPAK